MYDVLARSLKRSRVIITIDFCSSAKKKSRVDAQKRVSLKIAFDSKSETKKKKMKKKKKNVKKKENEENEEEKEKNKDDEADDDDEKNDDVNV